MQEWFSFWGTDWNWDCCWWWWWWWWRWRYWIVRVPHHLAPGNFKNTVPYPCVFFTIEVPSPSFIFSRRVWSHVDVVVWCDNDDWWVDLRSQSRPRDDMKRVSGLFMTRTSQSWPQHRQRLQTDVCHVSPADRPTERIDATPPPPPPARFKCRSALARHDLETVRRPPRRLDDDIPTGGRRRFYRHMSARQEIKSKIAGKLQETRTAHSSVIIAPWLWTRLSWRHVHRQQQQQQQQGNGRRWARCSYDDHSSANWLGGRVRWLRSIRRHSQSQRRHMTTD